MNLTSRLDTIKSIPNLVNRLKSTLEESEQKALNEAMVKLDSLQVQILDLFRLKKADIIAKIREHYRSERK